MAEDLEPWGKRRWRMANGKMIRWSDMAIDHLRNAADFAVRQHEDGISAGYQALCSVQGEMAECTIESALAAAEDELQAIREFAQQMRDYADWRAAQTEFEPVMAE